MYHKVKVYQPHNQKSKEKKPNEHEKNKRVEERTPDAMQKFKKTMCKRHKWQITDMVKANRHHHIMGMGMDKSRIQRSVQHNKCRRIP